MRPIPARWLTDTAWVRNPDPAASRGGQYLAPSMMDRVRYERGSGVTEGMPLMDGQQARLYVDAVTSSVPDLPQVGARVSVDGQRTWLTVREVKELRDLAGTHHWELVLS